MSGRDLRNFVTNHRIADKGVGEVERMKDGFYSSKYKQVDYDKLKALASEKKFAGQVKLVKVKKLQQVSKHGKEQNLLKQHQLVWRKEFARLSSLRGQLEAEVDNHILRNADSDVLGQIYDDLDNYSNKLSRDLEKFRSGTAVPVWNLREDLKFWAQAQQTNTAIADIEQDPEQVRATVTKVKSQQANILDRLEQEQDALELQLRTGELPTISAFPARRIQTGIPEEAFDLECPDLDLKASVLQEFILIDQKYMEKLREIELQHTTATKSPTGDWSEEDHFIYTYVVDQYTHDTQNRRTLYIDRLKRHLSHMSRADIVAHEEWWLLYKYYNERRRDLVLDWTRDRAEMMNKAMVTFAEFVASQDLSRKKEENKLLQQQLCEALYSKVRDWREEKMEVLRLQQEQQEQKRQLQLEQNKRQDERERIRREKDKEKLEDYHADLSAEREKQEEQTRRRLEQLRKRHEEQAEYDRERVHFREVEALKKEQDKQQLLEDRLLAEEEKQNILEKIREKVRPHVEGDLMRLWSDTESWQARVRGKDEFINIQKPLYEVNTFTSQQVQADPRFRLIERLHEAGLTKNAYARDVFSQVQPAQPPRRDMASTVFKHL